MSTIPNVVGAICLNQAGMDLTKSHQDVLVKLITSVASPSHGEALSERDNAQHLGAALDELVRHHPPLRSIVFDAVMGLLRQTVEQGAAFVPPPHEAHNYIVERMPLDTGSSSDATRTTSSLSNPPLSAFHKIFKVKHMLLCS